MQPVVQDLLILGLKQGIRTVGDGAQRARHGGDPITREDQAVSSWAGLVVVLQVRVVDAEQFGFVLEQPVGDVLEHRLAGLVGGLRQFPGGPLDLGTLLQQVSGRHCFSVMAARNDEEGRDRRDG